MPIPYYPGPELQSVPTGASKIWEAPVDLLLLPVAPLILGYFLIAAPKFTTENFSINIMKLVRDDTTHISTSLVMNTSLLMNP